jgi:hypothetical protein
MVTPGTLEQFFLSREALQQTGQASPEQMISLAAEYGLSFVSPVH